MDSPPYKQNWHSSASLLRARIARAGLAVGLRQFLVHGTNVLGGVILARLLAPADFGIYALVLFLGSFLTTLAGTGLASNLIRSPQEPTTGDLRALFTVQEALVLAAAAALAAASGRLAQWYGLGHNGWQLFALTGIALVAASLQAIPQVLLERDLRFPTVALIESLQALAFNATAIGLAWRGFGAVSFGWALAARALVGAVLANLAAPWPIGLLLERCRLEAHLKFGLYFAGSNVVSLVKDAINPIFIGALLGMAQVGFVNWAMMVAAYTSVALLGLQRVYMPSFARMMTHPGQLSSLIQTVLEVVNGVAAPVAVTTLALIGPITRTIFGAKWLPAIPLFYLFWAANMLVPSAMPLLGLLNASGRAKTALSYNALWLAMIWGLGAPLILALGPPGLGIASIATQLTLFALIKSAHHVADFRILMPTIRPWLAAATPFAVLLLAARLWPTPTAAQLLALVLLGLALYAGCTALIQGPRLRNLLRSALSPGWLRA